MPSLHPDGISALDLTTMRHSRVHPDTNLVVLGRGAQDARIPRQVRLGQRRHHAADAGARDGEPDRLTDGERAADPGILYKISRPGDRGDHDVRPKSRDLETPLRIELVEPIERSRGQDMHGRTVEECTLGDREVGDRVSVLEALHVGPVSSETIVAAPRSAAVSVTVRPTAFERT